MGNKVAHFAVLIIVVVWMSCSAKLLEVGAQQFCSRAAEACAKPPTVDDLQVEEYLGKWYEMGSTATFKLFTEAGLACNQARYTSSPHANLSLLNSGLRVISPLAVAEVGAVNVAARGICGGAREVCFQVAAVRQLSQSLTNLTLHSSTNHQSLLQLADDLASSANAAEQTLQDLADDVSLIQEENGQISQANYSSARSLQSSADAMNEYVKAASKEQGAIASLASNLNKIRARVWEMGHKSWSEESKLALEQASVALGSIALKVGASSSVIEVGLKAVGLGAKALLKNGQPIEDGRVSSVTGAITQPSAVSAGKLEVTINGGKAPYWIIGVEKSEEGAYSAALVYSCTAVAKSLFVLSREPEVQKGTLDAFLAKAHSLGIYNDCEDPFLLTLQRGGDCGKPSSSP